MSYNVKRIKIESIKAGKTEPVKVKKKRVKSGKRIN
jgi:hypothetical protein